MMHKITTITRDIHAIQEEMHGKLTEYTAGNALPKFFEDGASVQALNDFKAELDQLRRILWFYIQEAAGHLPAGAAHDPQDNRLQRVNELLRALAPKQGETGAHERQPSISFFERLDMVMDTYMQEKKPVAPARAKAAKAGN